MTSVPSKLMTAEEFYDWCYRDENRDRNFELERGLAVELPLTTWQRGFVCGKLGFIFGEYTRAKRCGYVCTNNVGLILERNPDTVRGPDIAIFLENRRFEDLEIGYVERLPAVVVEVLSLDDPFGEVVQRINKYLEKGISMAWRVDPDSRMVFVHLPNQLPIVFEGEEELTGFEVLPDFRCKVSELFKSAGE
jgi:Uma2 family endonuclease